MKSYSLVIQMKAIQAVLSAAVLFMQNKKLSELKPARDAHSCHITNIEPLAPGLTPILRSLAGYCCNAQ